MTLSDDSSIESLALRFIDARLPKAEWTHEGHFAAALWLCRHRPDLAAPDEIRTLITRYNAATGTPNTETEGYHHTITLASMRAAHHHLRSHAPDAPLHQVLRALMASAHGRTDWLLAYWHRDTLFSPAARRAWHAPDKADMPF
ncbi:hypothetical protein [Novosphingobium mangrovi (ex Huang et al. 2023)]|uniref:Uncharacterized protein n=1 Tax=Novosphingobium mangrovi (ex Huang et al. 2023) TaxID=2976432 RepID=A0ABT2I5X7_9SPHN|nr:hypothetical protein [Novosphingobium mangrovi (ex Huang et al. 2023)]MCT2400208.1 hypothetical protein [Novosphingobium mangrovi (ex Huang et al. 2023)]